MPRKHMSMLLSLAVVAFVLLPLLSIFVSHAASVTPICARMAPASAGGAYTPLFQPPGYAPAPEPGARARNSSGAAQSILITEVYYDTYALYDADEYVRIYNPSSVSVNISGWYLTDLEDNATFPNGTAIGPGQCLYVAKNGTSFLDEEGFEPDFEMNDSSPGIANAIVQRWGIQLNNDGDEVLLKDQNGTVIDAMIYDNSSYSGAGWGSRPVYGVSSGVILRRNSDYLITGQAGLAGASGALNGTGAHGASAVYYDTNTSSDWEYGRVYRVRQSNFGLCEISYTGNITVFTSPDSSFEAFAREIDSATASIWINVYEFTSTALMERLLNATRRGVSVNMLLDGNPVGFNFTNVAQSSYTSAFTEAYTEKYILAKLHDAGCDIRFMISDDTQRIYDRYRFDHAKYAVFDDARVLITTENFKPTGFPVDESSGNRGWGVVVRNETAASYVKGVFLDDWNITKKDIRQFNDNDTVWGPAPQYFAPSAERASTSPYAPRFSSRTIYGAFNITLVLSPDTTLAQDGIIEFINSSTTSIYAEQLDCSINWSNRYYPPPVPNMYLDALLSAAKRGVESKVILDSRYVNEFDNTEDNADTVRYINSFSASNALGTGLDARLSNANMFDKVHAKVAVVDGKKVLISSINWNRGSSIDNREIGIIIENEDAAHYFTEAFMYDWNGTQSAGTAGSNSGTAATGNTGWFAESNLIPLSGVALAFAIGAATGASLLRDRFNKSRRGRR